MLAAAMLAAGCGIARPDQLGEPRCADYDADIQPVLTARCGSCHGPQAQEGGYRVDDYRSTLARRDDGSARLLPGDDASAFLRAARGELAGHSALPEDERAALTDWAVRCRAGPRPSKVHPPGWGAPTDEESFHGKVLRRQGYEVSECRDCHGADLRGGGALAVSSTADCSSCHAGGPFSCGTCHGGEQSPAPPRSLSGARSTTSLGVGAHQAHLTDGPLHRALRCDACHAVPAAAEDEGHYREGGAPGDLMAEVTMRGAPGETAVWDRSSATCQSSYCHSPAGPDPAATNQSPTWTAVGAGQAACGTCHGNPPADHSRTECDVCHGAGYAGGAVALDLHVNGVVDVRGQGQACDSCHGDAAAFRDLLGRTSAQVQTVGAHRAHLEARTLRGPIGCEECHLVPAQLTSPGHLDSAGPAEVFPDLPGVGTVARAGGANPSYSPTTGTCASVSCHGGSARLSTDTSPNLQQNPGWTGGASQVACGTCHGTPPEVDGHPATPSALSDCMRCHPRTVAPDGGLIVNGLPDGGLDSFHINGVVNFP